MRELTEVLIVHNRDEHFLYKKWPGNVTWCSKQLGKEKLLRYWFVGIKCSLCNWEIHSMSYITVFMSQIHRPHWVGCISHDVEMYPVYIQYLFVCVWLTKAVSFLLCHKQESTHFETMQEWTIYCLDAVILLACLNANKIIWINIVTRMSFIWFAKFSPHSLRNKMISLMPFVS